MEIDDSGRFPCVEMSVHSGMFEGNTFFGQVKLKDLGSGRTASFECVFERAALVTISPLILQFRPPEDAELGDVTSPPVEPKYFGYAILAIDKSIFVDGSAQGVDEDNPIDPVKSIGVTINGTAVEAIATKLGRRHYRIRLAGLSSQFDDKDHGTLNWVVATVDGKKINILSEWKAGK